MANAPKDGNFESGILGKLVGVGGAVPIAAEDNSGDYALHVHVASSDVASEGGGSGVEYTEGDVDVTITGKAFMWEDTSDTLRAVSAAKPLPISVATIPSHAVTNAGVFAVQATLQAGSASIGILGSNSGVDIGDVTINNASGASAVNIQDGGNTITVDGTVTTNNAAGTNNIGNVGLIGRTTGGLSIFRSLDIDESEEEIKGTAGQVFTITAFNRTATPLYLKFYNATAANVTVGSTTPVLTFLVPANADSDGAGFVISSEIGFAFGTAISVACTTGIADADTGAPGANDCLINIGYV